MFKPGDVVTLKSGGPDMTVTRVEHEAGQTLVFCAWFTGNKSEAGYWPAESLKLAE